MILSGKKDFETMSKEIQLQADTLITEFFDHYEQMNNSETKPIDQRVVFVRLDYPENCRASSTIKRAS